MKGIRIAFMLALVVTMQVGCGKGGAPQAHQTTGTVAKARVEAVARVTSPEALARIVREDKDKAVRLAALDKLTDEKLLAGLVLDGTDMEVRQRAMAKIKDPKLLADLAPWVNAQAAQDTSDPSLLAKLATRAWLAPIRVVALGKVSDPAVLAQVALDDPAGSVRKAAALKISDANTLADIAVKDPAWYVRQSAVDKIGDVSILARIARDDTDLVVSGAALVKLTSETNLVDVALHNGFAEVRRRALEGLTSQEALAKVARETQDAVIQELAYKRLTDPLAMAETAPWVESAAAGKVTDQALLGHLAETACNRDVRQVSAEHLSDQALLGKIARADSDEQVRCAAATRLQSQSELRSLVVGGSNDVREIAVKKLDDPSLLLEIVNRTNEEFNVRAAAVETLADEQVVIDLAENEEMPQGIRLAAVKKIKDQAVLAKIARSEEDWSVRNAARNSISNAAILADMEPWIKEEATRNVINLELLSRIALEASDSGVRKLAISRLSDQTLLVKIARDTNSPPDVRQAAIAGVEDQSVLTSLVGNTNTPEIVRIAVIEKLSDHSILSSIAEDGASRDSVRVAAMGKLSDQMLAVRIAGNTNNAAGVRLAAVKQICNQKELARIALTDMDKGVRNAAEGSITNEKILTIVRPWNNSSAVSEVEDPVLLARMARQSKLPEVRKAAIERVVDPAVQAEVAVKDTDKDVRSVAIKRVADQNVLAGIAREDSDAVNRKLATECLTDQPALEAIALNDGNNDVRKAAVERLTSQAVLAEVAQYESNDAIRQAALARLADAKLLEEATRWTKVEEIRNIEDPILLARMAYSAGSTNIRQAAVNQLTRSTNQAPQVAYEWLSHLMLKEGKRDDAVLAMLMATVAYDQDSSKNADLSLASFERANELRSQSAIQTGLALLGTEGESGGRRSLLEVVSAIDEASQGALYAQEERLVADVSRTFQKILHDGEGASRGSFTLTFRGETTNALRYVTGDVPFVSALGLSMLQRREDWPFIEKFLASDAYQPKFAGYLQAMSAQDTAFEEMLFSHPSAMIRANASAVLQKPAPPGETDMLVRCAGAWHPAMDGTNEAVRLLLNGLEDERHVVRVMAMRGLARLGVEQPMETIQRAMTSTDEWRKKYSLGCMVWWFTSAADPSLAGQQFTSASETYSENAVDCGLLLVGYGMVASRAVLSDDAFDWLLQQLKLKPDEGYPMFYLSSATDVDGYRAECAQPLSSDRMNKELTAVIAKHAPDHVEQLLGALREADPYGRMILLQAVERVATNAAVRAWLWRIAECGDRMEQKSYRDILYSEKLGEVQKGLMWNQSINYSALNDYADKLSEVIWQQNRRIAVNVLAATAEDEADFNRLESLLADGQAARSVLLLALVRDEETLLGRVPATLLKSEDAEVRMCAAIARLTVVDSPEVRMVLTDALKGDEDRICFAARLALRSKSIALAETVRAITGVKSISVAGFLLRQLEFAAQ